MALGLRPHCLSSKRVDSNHVGLLQLQQAMISNIKSQQYQQALSIADRSQSPKTRHWSQSVFRHS